MTDEQRVASAIERYQRHMHGMQAGVAIDVADGEKNIEPKHLRVGVNSAMVESSALAQLLISKGVITQVEYLEALANGAEAEHRSYEKTISERKNARISLV